jgi:hypothetical protein
MSCNAVTAIRRLLPDCVYVHFSVLFLTRTEVDVTIIFIFVFVVNRADKKML